MLLRTTIVPALVSLSLTAAGATAQGKVWIVDASRAPGTWWEPQHVVPNAKDGDLVLVRTGDYGGVTIHDKALTIVADARTGPVRFHTVVVDRLAAGKNVTFRGIDIGPTLLLGGCAGSVAFDGCTMRPSASYRSSIHLCKAVTMSRCDLRGSQPGDTAMIVGESTVHIHDSELHGCPGGPAITVMPRARVVASGSRLLGGDGVPGTVLHGFCYLGPRAGGPAVRLERGAIELHGCVVAGGKAVPAVPPCPGAPGGAAFQNNQGTILQTSVAPGRLRADSPVREGELLTIEIEGQPGDHAWLLFNLHHDPVFVPGCTGALFPSLNGIGVAYAGQVQSGAIKLGFVVQPMAASTEFNSLALQALLLPKTGCVLGPAASVVLLDRRF